jgi:hypothetical protein
MWLTLRQVVEDPFLKTAQQYGADEAVPDPLSTESL